MRLRSIPAVLAAIIAIGAMTASDAYALHKQSYEYKFREDSRLATGKWVKVRIDRTGIYEISYDRLREMGFSDPSRVGVYGIGGQMCPTSFTDATFKVRMMEDDPRPVAICRAGDKFYFYAQGLEDIRLKDNLFNHNPLNIYSTTGVYYLSDCEAPVEMAIDATDTETPAWRRTDAIDYLCHEVDLVHNASKAGRLYWGEDLAKTPHLEWDVVLPYAVPASDVNLELGLCVADKFSSSLDIDFCDMKQNMSLFKSQAKLEKFVPEVFRMPASKQSRLSLSFISDDDPYCGLDYWIITYRKNLPTEMTPAFVQEPLALAASSQNISGCVTVPEGAMVFDVSDPYNPIVLPVAGSDAFFPVAGSERYMVVMDPAKGQYQLLPGYEEIANQNLHALQRDGYDLLIFAVPAMRQYAERIAELHRRYDGISVYVADPEQVYNEFSAGMPDPMAFRAMAKMLYQNTSHPLKNILFMGPIYGDYRGIEVDVERPYGFVGMEEFGEMCESELAGVMDYAGYASDCLPSNNTLHALAMEMGVGVLPINSDTQGELAVNKIQEYLIDLHSTAFAEISNETLTASCPGDSNTHDVQACQIQDLIQRNALDLSRSVFPHSNIQIEAYGYDAARNRFINRIEDGKLLSVYFGHAAAPALAGTFLQCKDFVNMRNRHLGFMFMAGCELAAPDRGLTGIGEVCVTEAPRALVGSITTSRTVWSNHNYDFCEKFIDAMFYNGSIPRRNTPTIGEVYALAKTRTENSNELCFYYVGDPALKFPISMLRSTLRDDNTHGYRGGEIVNFNGEIYDQYGQILRDYNGEAVIKVKEPLRTDSITVTKRLNSQGIIIGIDTTSVKYRDLDIISTKVPVRNGRYSGRLRLPDSVEKFRSNPENPTNLVMYVCAYDPEDGRSASGTHQIEMAQYGAAPIPGLYEADTEDPVLSISYDSSLGVVRVGATDNVGLTPGVGGNACLRISLDGKPVQICDDDTYNVSGAQEYSVSVPVAHLTPGQHSVTAIAYDQAGNYSYPKNYKFTIGESGDLRIKALSTAVVDIAEFRVAGLTNGMLTCVIRNAKGEKVYEGEVDPAGFSWDCSEMPSGLYRAAVFANSHAGNRVYSNWTEFSVID